MWGASLLENHSAYKILRAGYFWPSLFTDVCAKIRACAKCQKFSGKKQLKSLPLKPVAASGPFNSGAWILSGKFIPLPVVNIDGS
jgi:hypothetical protein